MCLGNGKMNIKKQGPIRGNKFDLLVGNDGDREMTTI